MAKQETGLLEEKGIGGDITPDTAPPKQISHRRLRVWAFFFGAALGTLISFLWHEPRIFFQPETAPHRRHQPRNPQKGSPVFTAASLKQARHRSRALSGFNISDGRL